MAQKLQYVFLSAVGTALVGTALEGTQLLSAKKDTLSRLSKPALDH